MKRKATPTYALTPEEMQEKLGVPELISVIVRVMDSEDDNKIERWEILCEPIEEEFKKKRKRNKPKKGKGKSTAS